MERKLDPVSIEMLDRIGDKKVRAASGPNRGKSFVIPAVDATREADRGLQ